MSEEVAELEEGAAPATASSAPGYTYDEIFQKKIVCYVLTDPDFAVRTDGLIDPNHFENPYDAILVDIGQEYFTKYRKTPDLGSFKKILKDGIASRKLSESEGVDVIARIKEVMRSGRTDREYVIDEVSSFAKYRAMEEAVIKASYLVAKKDYAGIEKIMRQAMQVGAQEGAGAYDYFKEIESRTEYRKALLTGTIVRDSITTGCEELDRLLYHRGWGRRELSILMARAKFGKSMGLGDFAKNASMAGHNVILFTAEQSASIYSDRLDANFSETAMEVLGSKPSVVEKAIKAAQAKAGKLIIHDFPSGTLKPSMMRRVIQHHKNNGLTFALCVMDYLDIFAPEHSTGIPREDSRLIWIEARAIMQQENMAGLSATQTNRDGAKATTASATDVAEDYNKIRTADLVISGNATEAELRAGKARLHAAATRNQKEFTIEIEQDRSTMRFLKKVLGVIH